MEDNEPKEIVVEDEEEEDEDHDEQSQSQTQYFFDADGDESDNPEDLDTMAVMGAANQPSYKRANKIPFYGLCKRLEYLERFIKEKDKAKRNLSKEEKLNILLPAKELARIQPGSVFPLFRLLMMERDSTLQVRTKEKSLSNAYCEALGYEKNSKQRKALERFEDAKFLMPLGEEFQTCVGEFPMVLLKVLEKRIKNEPSKARVGDIVEILEGLTKDLKKSGTNNKKQSNHDWRGGGADSQSQSQAAPTMKPKKKKNKVGKIRTKWIQKAKDDLKLSPLEHKWLAKMLLNRLGIGIGWEQMLSWYSPHATDLWNSHNNLKTVCNKLCNEAYVKQREKEMEEARERLKSERFARFYNFPANADPVFLGNTISAMKSERTGFESLMHDMRKPHALVLKKQLDRDDPLKNSLALKFPAFIAEVKLDGERMVVHVNRGEVTMHTRQGRWYSRPYSPIVGPALRRALSKYDVDVILDGEILAWDNWRGESVPFGSNRTVAILRRKWLAARGELEEIDVGLHMGEEGKHVITIDDMMAFEGKDADLEDVENGADCWLKYVVFDVLYVGGKDSKKLIADSLPPDQAEKTTPGSIIHLSGFERRRILYNLIEPQENAVEVVQSVVIRPNGDCVRGEEYFSPTDPLVDSGAPAEFPAYVIDSAKWTLNTDIDAVLPTLKDIDEERSKGRSDMVISSRRTNYVNQFYHTIVDRQKMEGIVVKDLACNYIPKTKTRLWLKLKPDYSGTSVASDIDVLVIGGSFATGCRRAGQLSSFLCACLDKDYKDKESCKDMKYFTFCRINAKSLKEGILDVIMRHTGFSKATADKPGSHGKWFREERHGETLPDFITDRTYQTGQDKHSGWRFDKVKNYPDLFIRPEDSVVLTLNASEIVRSDEYSCGWTLRFPRATELRLEATANADAKGAEDVVTDGELHSMYREFKNMMRKYSSTGTSGFDPTSPSKSSGVEQESLICQFLTAEQHNRNEEHRIKQKRSKGNVQRLKVSVEDHALAGLKFFVLEGVYLFDENGLDKEDAKEEGWFEEACKVRKAMDVRHFIAKHGGTVVSTSDRDAYIIGGNLVDAQVKYKILGFESQRDKEAKRKKKLDLDISTNEQNVDVPGVLKWTFVFSVVHRWLKRKKELAAEEDSSDDEEEEEDDEEVCIKVTLPELLSPRFFDFLAQSEVYGEDPYESIWKVENVNTAGMKRALNFLQESSDSRVNKQARVTPAKDLVPWQVAAIESLSEEDRWVMSCQHQTLWPYRSESNDVRQCEKAQVILYADLFGDDFGASSTEDACLDDWKGSSADRWKEMTRDSSMSSLASALPLLRCMGALVTGHLHSDVTHVLCNLKDGLESLVWNRGDSPDVFPETDHGRMLIERLNTVKDNEKSKVLLVSLNWVHSKWNH